MAIILKLIISLCLFVIVVTEKSNLKELDSGDNDDSFMNLFNNEELETKNERYARNVKAITESALDHLVNEIRYEYFKNNYQSNNPLRKFIREFNEETERKKLNKLIKDNRNEKMTNKKKKPKKRKKTTKTATVPS